MDGKWSRPAWCYVLHFLRRGENGVLVSPAICGKRAAHRAVVGWYEAPNYKNPAQPPLLCPKCLELGAPPRE